VICSINFTATHPKEAGMPTITYTTEAEKQAYERAIAFVAEMHALGLSAPDGSVLDACEALTLSQGRDFLREALAGAAQARIDDVEKK
jgi:hypothetical protein